MAWEWKVVSEESSRAMSFPAVLPSNVTDYGGREAYDDEEPLTQYTFRGVGVPKSQVALIRSAYRTRGSKYTLTDKLGDSHTGWVTGYRFENVDGCTRYGVELQMTKVTTELT